MPEEPTMLSLLLASLIGQVDGPPPHLAEQVLQTELATARKAYLRAVNAATKRAKDALERAGSEALKRGDARLSLAYKARAKELVADAPPLLTGEYTVTFDDKTTDNYTFSIDGSTVSRISAPTEPKAVRWVYQGDSVNGIVFWGDGTAQVFKPARNGRATLWHYPHHSAIIGRMEKAR